MMNAGKLRLPGVLCSQVGIPRLWDRFEHTGSGELYHKANAFTVGAMADPGELGFGMATFSSRGPTQDNRLKPEIVAPGYQITAPKANTANAYATYSGTSMATPFDAVTLRV